jgi:hypothetical protein
VLYSLDNIAGASLALCAYHGGTFGDAAECLTEVSAATNEGNLEWGFLNMVDVVGRSKNLGFVNVIDANCLKNLGGGLVIAKLIKIG